MYMYICIRLWEGCWVCLLVCFASYFLCIYNVRMYKAVGVVGYVCLCALHLSFFDFFTFLFYFFLNIL